MNSHVIRRVQLSKDFDLLVDQHPSVLIDGSVDNFRSAESDQGSQVRAAHIHTCTEILKQAQSMLVFDSLLVVNVLFKKDTRHCRPS